MTEERKKAIAGGVVLLGALILLYWLWATKENQYVTDPVTGASIPAPVASAATVPATVTQGNPIVPGGDITLGGSPNYLSYNFPPPPGTPPWVGYNPPGGSGGSGSGCGGCCGCDPCANEGNNTENSATFAIAPFVSQLRASMGSVFGPSKSRALNNVFLNFLPAQQNVFNPNPQSQGF